MYVSCQNIWYGKNSESTLNQYMVTGYIYFFNFSFHCKITWGGIISIRTAEATQSISIWSYKKVLITNTISENLQQNLPSVTMAHQNQANFSDPEKTNHYSTLFVINITFCILLPSPPLKKAEPPSSMYIFLVQSSTPRYVCWPLLAFT